jgi:hypothetical protein
LSIFRFNFFAQFLSLNISASPNFKGKEISEKAFCADAFVDELLEKIFFFSDWVKSSS